MLDNKEHPIKAVEFIVATLLGKEILGILTQSLKAEIPILVTPLGTVIAVFIFVHPSKVASFIAVIVPRLVTDVNAEQFLNALAPIVITEDGILILGIFEQSLNTFAPRVFTDDGMSTLLIMFKQPSNADAAIVVILLVNVKEVAVIQFLKTLSPIPVMVYTVPAILIVFEKDMAVIPALKPLAYTLVVPV
jgi:hypothetical protein